MMEWWSWYPFVLGFILAIFWHLGGFFADRGHDKRQYESAIRKRADQQHLWELAGDPRGIYGPNFHDHVRVLEAYMLSIDMSEGLSYEQVRSRTCSKS